MKLKSFLCAFLLGCGMWVHAASSHMIVELSSGDKYSFLLNDKPVITFSDDLFVVNGNATTSYALSDVKSYYFGDGSGVLSGVMEELSFQVLLAGESTLQINHASANVPIRLVSVKGEVLSSVNSDHAGSATIELPHTKGVYLIVVGNRSFKVIRK